MGMYETSLGEKSDQGTWGWNSGEVHFLEDKDVGLRTAEMQRDKQEDHGGEREEGVSRRKAWKLRQGP